MSPRLYTIPEAAKILRLSPFTVYKWISQGKIKAVKLGAKSYRIEVKEIDRLLDTKK